LTATSCPGCGGTLVDGSCPACEGSQWRLVHREFMLLALLVGIAAVSFSFTRAAAASNRRMHMRDAAAAYQTGRQELRQGDAAGAVTALRRAIATERDNRQYQLALANALAANHQDDAERQVLLSLREQSPEDPEINVRLARSEARTGSLAMALRYYQNALYGFWPETGAAARRELRIELINYLLTEGQQGRALSELLLLAADLPDTAPAHVQAARLFMGAGDPRRALTHFKAALRLAPGDTAAQSGAGEASFQAGDYAHAVVYLRDANQSTSLSELRTVAQLVIESDPLTRRLSTDERTRRLNVDLKRAQQRLDACLQFQTAAGLPAGELNGLRAELQTFTRRAATSGVREPLELIESGVELIYRIENVTSQSCAAATLLDRALLLIGKQYASGQQ
jgi:tetratricopeptide (TPR) repeat protein